MPRFITWKATTTQNIPSATAATSVTVGQPTCASGDVEVAAIAMGNTGASTVPTFTEPAGWTLVRRSDHGSDTALLVYWHTAGAIEPSTYTWQFSAAIEGVAWISCYANVDPVAPIDVELGTLILNTGPTYATPSITTTVANAMVVATYASHVSVTPTTWSAPAGTSVRANLNNGTTRSGLGIDEPVAAAGPTGALAATASVVQNYALVHVLALKPAP